MPCRRCDQTQLSSSRLFDTLKRDHAEHVSGFGFVPPPGGLRDVLAYVRSECAVVAERVDRATSKDWPGGSEEAVRSLGLLAQSGQYGLARIKGALAARREASRAAQSVGASVIEACRHGCVGDSPAKIPRWNCSSRENGSFLLS